MRIVVAVLFKKTRIHSDLQKYPVGALVSWNGTLSNLSYFTMAMCISEYCLLSWAQLYVTLSQSIYRSCNIYFPKFHSAPCLGRSCSSISVSCFFCTHSSSSVDEVPLALFVLLAGQHTLCY